ARPVTARAVPGRSRDGVRRRRRDGPARRDRRRDRGARPPRARLLPPRAALAQSGLRPADAAARRRDWEDAEPGRGDPAGAGDAQMSVRSAQGALTPALSQRERGRGKLGRQEAVWGLLFVTPWIVGFTLWILGPMLFSLGLVFADWQILSPPQF